MNDQVRMIIYKKKCIYDNIIITLKFLCKLEDCISGIMDLKELNTDAVVRKQKLKLHPIILHKKGFDAYLASAYVYCMNDFDSYRKSAFDKLTHFIQIKALNLNTVIPVILVKLRTPKYQFLDYGWNQRLTQMIMIRQEIDYTMSWLSTLGGAFSALGDKFNHCAKVAGKISLVQFKLSTQLGDPHLVARCKLYEALSLFQQGYFKIGKQMVKKIYKFGIKYEDIRLQNMCKGVWSKFKFYYVQEKQRRNMELQNKVHIEGKK